VRLERDDSWTAGRPQRGRGAPNACKLLTASIAKTLIGPDAHKTADTSPNPAMSHCQYKSSGPGANRHARVVPGTVIRIQGGAIDVLVSNDFGLLRPIEGPTPIAVHGIGDEAYASATSLVVRKGSKGLVIPGATAAGDFWGPAATAQGRQQATLEEKAARLLLPDL
jgi:hypothetical protein